MTDERTTDPWCANCQHEESRHGSLTGYCFADLPSGNKCQCLAFAGVAERPAQGAAAPVTEEAQCVVCGRTASDREEDSEHELTYSGSQPWHCAPLTGCAAPLRHAFDLAAMQEAFDIGDEEAALRVVRERFGTPAVPQWEDASVDADLIEAVAVANSDYGAAVLGSDAGHAAIDRSLAAKKALAARLAALRTALSSASERERQLVEALEKIGIRWMPESEAGEGWATWTTVTEAGEEPADTLEDALRTIMGAAEYDGRKAAEDALRHIAEGGEPAYYGEESATIIRRLQDIARAALASRSPTGPETAE